ncbi:hypothetical protein MMC07_006686 [Pseudocyphellaria aurata]|nr:hypothetical protein [Pseudocyphellaria aurata]
MFHSAVLLIGIGIFASFLAFNIFRSFWRLKSIPGPFWAGLTNLSRVQWVRSRRAHEIHMNLHDQYGDCVRFGPNMVSIADPEAIPTVYPMRPGFVKRGETLPGCRPLEMEMEMSLPEDRFSSHNLLAVGIMRFQIISLTDDARSVKSDFYKVLMPYTKNGALPAVFNTRDETVHKQLKTPIAPLFSVSNVTTLESFVDAVLDVMCHALDERFVQTGKIFDLADWLQYFAFDVMGTLTFSKRYGFLENGHDVDGMLQAIWQYMDTAAPITQITWFDEWWNKNSWIARFRQPLSIGILGYVGKLIRERQEQSKNGSDKCEESEELNDRDMLSRFIEIQTSHSSVPPWAVTAWTFSNVTAGSDSTGVILRTVWYNLLSHPSTLATLYSELRQANLTLPYPKWNEVRELPYLDACINEALRLHPPFCLPFERVVPKEGVTILGRFFEAGTVVGMSPYVVGRHKGTFGADADHWRPGRWIGIAEEKHRKMEQSILTVSDA